MFGNVSNSKPMDLCPLVVSKKRPISEVNEDFEDKVGGLASPIFEVIREDANVESLSKKMKITEMVDADETMEITDPRAKGLVMAIRDKGLQEVLKEVENHNKTNEFNSNAIKELKLVFGDIQIINHINPQTRDANFYEIGMQNAVKILKFVQEIEGQCPGSYQQFADEILNPPAEAGPVNSEELLIGMVDFVADITQELENFTW